MSVAGTILLSIGVLVLLVASAGLFVFRDALSRQHAATKAGSLGVVFVMAGTAMIGGDWAWSWRALVIVASVWATLPVASHVLARAAFREQSASVEASRNQGSMLPAGWTGSAKPCFPLQVFFDGACPLCSREIDHYRRQDRQGRLKPIDISAPDFDPRRYGIARESFLAELHAIDRTGTVYRGVAAFRAIWQAFPEKTAYRVMGWLVGLPLVEPLAGVAYRLFARLRPHLPGRKAGCDSGSCRIDR